MKPDLRCYYHPDRTATSQCDRCGDYLCAECVKKLDGQFLCVICKKQLTPCSEVLSDTDLKRQAVFLYVVLGVVWAIACASIPLLLSDRLDSPLGRPAGLHALLEVLTLMALPAAVSAYSFLAAWFARESTHYRFCLFVMILHSLLLPLGLAVLLLGHTCLSSAGAFASVRRTVIGVSSWMSQWGIILSVLGCCGLSRLLHRGVKGLFRENKTGTSARSAPQ